MEGHVLTAASPALWNDEGNGNDAIYGLSICMFLSSVITHLQDTETADQWKTISRLYMHVLVMCCTAIETWGNDYRCREAVAKTVS